MQPPPQPLHPQPNGRAANLPIRAYQPTQPPKGKERGVEREGEAEEGEEGHRAVRGRWAPPPMEGKGPRDGQSVAIGQ